MSEKISFNQTFEFMKYEDKLNEKINEQTQHFICFQFVQKYIFNCLKRKFTIEKENPKFNFNETGNIFNKTLKSFSSFIVIKVDAKFYETCFKFLENQELWMTEFRKYIREDPRELFTITVSKNENQEIVIFIEIKNK